MRRTVNWFLGSTLVAQLLHTINMLQATYVERLAAPNPEVKSALNGEYAGWTLTAILVLVGLVLFAILSRAVRKELERAGRPS